MRLFLVTMVLCFAALAKAQVTVMVNLPPVGLSVKNQLWNLILTNSGTTAINVHAELQLTDATTNAQVLNATTVVWPLGTGAHIVQASTVSPIQYNVTDPAFQQFNNSDFLPVGHFLACYSLWKHAIDGTEKLVEECEEIIIEPLSPPQLVYPYNQSILETTTPVFSWLPPSPIQLFTGMQYEIQLVEVLATQTEYDAIQQNIPIYSITGIAGTSWTYPASGVSLEEDKKYAWRVRVRNNQALVAETETWWFKLNDKVKKDSSQIYSLPYIKMKKGETLGYAIVQNELKFEYINEAGDTTWNAELSDLSSGRQLVQDFTLDSVKLKPGQNMVRLAESNIQYLIDKHLYLLKLENSRRELWQLKFEYRRKGL